MPATFAHGTSDYNGHWGVRDLCDICRSNSSGALQQPTDTDMRTVLDHCGFDTPWEVDDGHVWTTGLGEQRRSAVQHRLNYQIWDIETPHVLDAHGRSLTGQALDPE